MYMYSQGLIEVATVHVCLHVHAAFTVGHAHVHAATVGRTCRLHVHVQYYMYIHTS